QLSRRSPPPCARPSHRSINSVSAPGHSSPEPPPVSAKRSPSAEQPVGLFYSYSHRDERLRARLEEALAVLHRTGVVESWSDRRITAGTQIDTRLTAETTRANVILFLVSPSFVASDYCWGTEVQEAMRRVRDGRARVIPVILRPIDGWQSLPFGRLLALPSDG